MFSCFLNGILRNSTESYGIRIYEEILYENARFPFFYGIIRNSTEFAFMKRFFIRMYVFPFLRNSTEFRGIFFVGVDVFFDFG